MAKNKNELTTVNPSQLPALPDEEALREIVGANLEGVKAAFEMIKIPTGGLTYWQVPTDTEKPEMVEEIQGVILDHYPTRVYWREKYGQGSGNQPPTCFSLNGITGSLPREGDEFGECATCKWAQFGTATKQDGTPARGQACNVKHRVFILMPDRSILPYLIPLSTMSSERKYEGSFSTFAVKQLSKMRKLSDIVTKIKLAEDRNTDGIKFAKAMFFFVAELSPEEKAKIASMKALFASTMRNKPFEADEVEETGNGHEEKSERSGKDPWDKPKL